MELLVTVADGALARAAIAALLQRGDTVRAVDAAYGAALPHNVAAHCGDIAGGALATALLAGVDAALHLAPLGIVGDEDVGRAARETFAVADTAAAAGVGRLVLGSTLAVFGLCAADWRVDPGWRPRPPTTPAALGALLCERTARELARESGLATRCVRLGAGLDAQDAVAALLTALDAPGGGWRIAHCGERLAAAPPPQIASRPIRNVVVFGAGGPLGAAVAAELATTYALRLTDLQPLDELAARPPQSAGAPRPVDLGAPHSWHTVDVTDAAQVLAACEGMDAIVNCSVIRRDPQPAWAVNLRGAHTIALAAVAHGIRRVVHTGPYQVAPTAASYGWDDDVPSDAPPRPGRGHFWELYFHTKYLGQELCRAYAEAHGLELPALLFCEFVDAAANSDAPVEPFSISWGDAARAVRGALEVESLPRPFEPLHISADLPHGVFSNEAARRVLGWAPRDTLENRWRASRREP